jgi:hypothetical protein
MSVTTMLANLPETPPAYLSVCFFGRFATSVGGMPVERWRAGKSRSFFRGRALLELGDHPQPGLRVRGGDDRPGQVPPTDAGPARPALRESLQEPSTFR